ncbi:hypothetical protein EJ377_04440 [Chryseobacterium arthrosphaerae]|uniref:Uncharacterized protein n=1 Tax=Chryseobacterium arthrosphaerae TaxID=651561 RepID=A0A432DZP7_9FLAO|nr:hypothetical protein EJ377_04440 [Chryseobacterium arthrosphaerae]
MNYLTVLMERSFANVLQQAAKGLTSYRTTDYLDGFQYSHLMVEVIFVWDAEPKMLTKYRRIKIF